eukprot:scaffold846_cov252-Pinguiococcus_pyrenoidosus.AAC.45
MFDISGETTLPQIFIRYGPMLYFVGVWERLEALNEADALPPPLLRQIKSQDPDYLTFSEVFECVGLVEGSHERRMSLSSVSFSDGQNGSFDQVEDT